MDTSVLVDLLRGYQPARDVLEQRRALGPLHASEVTRLEVLAGMRPSEERRTRGLLDSLHFHPLDAHVAEEAGALGRRWLASHGSIDSADLAIAATALHLGLPLLTMNVRHFPMLEGLRAPY